MTVNLQPHITIDVGLNVYRDKWLTLFLLNLTLFPVCPFIGQHAADSATSLSAISKVVQPSLDTGTGASNQIYSTA